MPKIEVNNVYKIFGTDPMDVLPSVKKGATKEKTLEETGHTVGLDNVSISVDEGETFEGTTVILKKADQKPAETKSTAKAKKEKASA